MCHTGYQYRGTASYPAPYPVMALPLGANCSAPEQCAGALVHCEMSTCACFWEAELAGESCDLTGKSYIAIGMRALYTVMNVSVVVHQIPIVVGFFRFFGWLKRTELTNGDRQRHRLLCWPARLPVGSKRLLTVQALLFLGTADFITRKYTHCGSNSAQTARL
jgi:hypothetical protein